MSATDTCRERDRCCWTGRPVRSWQDCGHPYACGCKAIKHRNDLAPHCR